MTENAPNTVNMAIINAASHQPTRQASWSPHATPIGVLTSRMGFAMRMLRSIVRWRTSSDR